MHLDPNSDCKSCQSGKDVRKKKNLFKKVGQIFTYIVKIYRFSLFFIVFGVSLSLFCAEVCAQAGCGKEP